MASLDQHSHNFELVRLKAQYRVAKVKQMRGETTQAFVQVKNGLLGRVLEFGNE